MDQWRFDELTRALGAGASRRRVARALGVGLLGWLGGLARPAGAGAKHKKRCDSPEDSYCPRQRRCVFSNCAMLGQVYNRRTCTCEEP